MYVCGYFFHLREVYQKWLTSAVFALFCTFCFLDFMMSQSIFFLVQTIYFVLVCHGIYTLLAKMIIYSQQKEDRRILHLNNMQFQTVIYLLNHYLVDYVRGL